MRPTLINGRWWLNLLDHRAARPEWPFWEAHTLALANHLIYGGTVLDYGSGVGRLTKPLARTHPRTRFVGVDTNPAMVKAAREDARPNEAYTTKLGEVEDLRSAFSVITFQHMTDRAVQTVIKRVFPVKFRFQFAVGDIQQPYQYQRDPEVVVAWCEKIGYRVEIEEDADFPTWCWVTAV